MQLGLTDGDFSRVRDHAAVGLVWTGLLPGRPSDVSALYVSRAGLSQGLPARAERFPEDAEWVIELTYAFTLTPAIRLQPDLQYVVNAGGRDRDVTLGILRVAIDF